MSAPTPTRALALVLLAGTIALGLSAPADAASATEATQAYPVLEVTQEGLTSRQAAALSSSLRPVLGKGAAITDAESAWRYYSPTSLVSGYAFGAPLPKRGGDDERGPSQKSGSWNLPLLAKADTGAMQAAAAAFGKATAALPLGEVRALARTSPMRLQVANPVTAALTFDRQVGATVGLDLTAAGLQVIGPGAQVGAMVGPDAKVAFAHLNVHALKASGETASMPTGSAASAACAAAISNGKPVSYRATPVYYVPSPAPKGSRIRPVLLCIPTVNGQELEGLVLLDPSNVQLPPPIGAGGVRIPEDPVGSTRFGTAYLGANAQPPLDVPQPDGSVIPFNGLNTEGLAKSLMYWGERTLALADNLPTNVLAGGANALADSVDLMWVATHGRPDGWQSDNGGLIEMRSVRLGAKDLEWLVSFACRVLFETGVDGAPWQLRLPGMFQGMHQLLGYGSVVLTSEKSGRVFANAARLPMDVFGTGLLPREVNTFPISLAWAISAIETQPTHVRLSENWQYDTQWAVVGTQNLAYDCLDCRQGDEIPGPNVSLWRLTGGA